MNNQAGSWNIMSIVKPRGVVLKLGRMFSVYYSFSLQCLRFDFNFTLCLHLTVSSESETRQ